MGLHDIPGTVSPVSYIVLQEQQPVNTNGGTFTTGAFRTRTLNTEVLDTHNDCTLSSNQFTLTAGTYDCYAWAPAGFVNQHKARLRNATDSVTLLVGTSEYAGTADADTNHSFIVGRFTIAASKALEIQHACAVTRATNGFGVAANLTEIEIYTTVQLWRVA